MAKDKDKPRYNRRLYAGIPHALVPTSRKILMGQAKKTVLSAYKPAFTELTTEESTLRAIDAKRASDNRYYNDWLQSKAAQFQAAAASSAAAQASQGHDIAQQAASDYSNLRNQLVQSNPGAVTNPNQQSQFDITPQAHRNLELIASARETNARANVAATDTAQMASSANFSTIAMRESQRQGDLYKSMSAITTARQKLAAARTGDAQKEAARLLDREITKAQAAMTIQGQRAATRVQAASLGETTRHHKAQEAQDKAQLAHDIKYDNAKLTEDIRNHNLINAAKKVSGQQQKAKLNQAFRASVASTVTWMKSQHFTTVADAMKAAQKKKGTDALISKAAAQLYLEGRIHGSALSSLQTIGFKIPNQWLTVPTTPGWGNLPAS
jgi:hypothetical protein